MVSVKTSDLRTVLAMALVGAVAGGLYARIAYISRPDAIGSVMLGITLGVLIGAGISFFETVFVSRPNSRIRQMPFFLSVLLRAVIYSFIIVTARILAQNIHYAVTGNLIMLVGVSQRDTITDLGFSIVMISILVFFMQMRNFIGARTFRNLLIGRYNKPRVEERVFMIVDVVGSTSLAQKIGDVKFHKFLNRIFILADDPINKFGGEVHSYVGDAVFVVWQTSSSHAANARALKTIAQIDHLIVQATPSIEQEFGIKPQVRIAVHKGSVVAGETGHRKRQITYLGNTVNIASRIEALTKSGIGPYLASEEYLRSVELPAGVIAEAIGDFEIKGSESKLSLFRITITDQ